MVDCLCEQTKNDLLVELPSGGAIDLGMDNIILVLSELEDVVVNSSEGLTINDFDQAYIEMYFDDIGVSNE